MKSNHKNRQSEFALIEQFLREGSFIVLGQNRQDPHPDLPLEAWAYQGPLDFNVAAPVTFGLGKDVKNCLSALDQQLKQSGNSARKMPQKAGLMIDPPPKETGPEPLWRVVYMIDVNERNAHAAAVFTHQIMTDPDSMTPVLDVIDADGNVTRIDLSEADSDRGKVDINAKGNPKA